MYYIRRLMGLLSILSTISLEGIIPHDLFEPSNVLLVPYMPPSCNWQFQIAYEGGFGAHGFFGGDGPFDQAPHQDHCSVNVLQIYQREQDAIAAFKGLPSDAPASQIAQQLHLDDDNHTHGLFVPCARLYDINSIPFAARFRLPYDLILGLYSAYRTAALSDITWFQKNPQNTFEQIISNDILTSVGELGGIDLFHGWRRHGFADSIARVECYRTFPQHKPWLQMTGLTVRLGILFPTGLKGDITKMLALPFGAGGGYGFHASGMLQLCYRHGIVLGVDSELTHFFGKTTTVRLKTDPQQTDLLLINTATAFIEPGFTQRFTMFAEKTQRGGGLVGTIAYEYFKRTEDILYPCASNFDIRVINNAEYLQEWTVHMLIFMLSYDWIYKRDWKVKPTCSAFLKVPFNGKRSLAASTAGFIFNVAF